MWRKNQNDKKWRVLIITKNNHGITNIKKDMPRRKSPGRLKSLALSAAARSMSRFIVDDFEKLPLPLIEELTQELKKYKILNYHMECVFQPRLKKLSLHQWSLDFSFPISYAVNMISRVCKNLTHLNLKRCYRITVSDLIELVQNIPNVKNLNLCETNTTDYVLSEIGRKCPLLEILDISSCTVHDHGIRSLCVQDLPTAVRSRNLNISSLFALFTFITYRGALIALRHLKKLKKLIHYDTGTALMFLYNEKLPHIDRESIFNLSLETFHHSGPISNRALDVATITCPNVKHIYFSSPTATDDDVQLFLYFERMETLTICNESQDGVTFIRGICSLIEIMGGKLTELTLDSIPDINLLTIGFCCPNLQSLSLSDVRGYKEQSSGESFVDRSFVAPFEHLTKFCIQGSHPDVPTEHLKVLLTNCVLLESGTFHFCQSLNDFLIESALSESNGLRCVTELEFRSCHHITRDGLMKLLEMDNPLEAVTVTCCRLITPRDILLMKEFVKEMNYDMAFC